eukprot:TRINITY_DN5022_c0_g1_i2.p1 TRINITY_DN5022_c0_g1~~TRINITY_DN5022_c0_g1_i2.p1  ORF type:complete len:965 (+),score=271.93 TRINITY_DN5022_c0_g1_i2:231-2897(+)
MEGKMHVIQTSSHVASSVSSFLALHAGMLHLHSQSHVSFFICSNDAALDTVAEQLRVIGRTVTREPYTSWDQLVQATSSHTSLTSSSSPTLSTSSSMSNGSSYGTTSPSVLYKLGGMTPSSPYHSPHPGTNTGHATHPSTPITTQPSSSSTGSLSSSSSTLPIPFVFTSTTDTVPTPVTNKKPSSNIPAVHTPPQTPPLRSVSSATSSALLPNADLAPKPNTTSSTPTTLPTPPPPLDIPTIIKQLQTLGPAPGKKALRKITKLFANQTDMQAKLVKRLIKLSKSKTPDPIFNLDRAVYFAERFGMMSRFPDLPQQTRSVSPPNNKTALAATGTQAAAAAAAAATTITTATTAGPVGAGTTDKVQTNGTNLSTSTTTTTTTSSTPSTTPFTSVTVLDASSITTTSPSLPQPVRNPEAPKTPTLASTPAPTPIPAPGPTLTSAVAPTPSSTLTPIIAPTATDPSPPVSVSSPSLSSTASSASVPSTSPLPTPAPTSTLPPPPPPSSSTSILPTSAPVPSTLPTSTPEPSSGLVLDSRLADKFPPSAFDGLINDDDQHEGIDGDKELGWQMGWMARREVSSAPHPEPVKVPDCLILKDKDEDKDDVEKEREKDGSPLDAAFTAPKIVEVVEGPAAPSTPPLETSCPSTLDLHPSILQTVLSPSAGHPNVALMTPVPADISLRTSQSTPVDLVVSSTPAPLFVPDSTQNQVSIPKSRSTPSTSHPSDKMDLPGPPPALNVDPPSTTRPSNGVHPFTLPIQLPQTQKPAPSALQSSSSMPLPFSFSAPLPVQSPGFKSSSTTTTTTSSDIITRSSSSHVHSPSLLPLPMPTPSSVPTRSSVDRASSGIRPTSSVSDVLLSALSQSHLGLPAANPGAATHPPLPHPTTLLATP